MSDFKSELDLDVLSSAVGVQINLTRRALWVRAGQMRPKRQPRRPSGYISTLVVIGANPGVSQKRLADALWLDAGALGDIVDMLEREQIVERRRDPADRRRINLYLTPQGEREWQRARAMNIEQDAVVTACLSREEVAVLLDLLKRIQK